MAQLKSTVVSGRLTVTDAVRLRILEAPSTAGGSSYTTGSTGYVLRTSSGSVYWCAVSDSTSASAISTNNYLVTERDVYYGLPTINGGHSYTSSTNYYVAAAQGSSGQILTWPTSGSVPVWANPAPTFPTGGEQGSVLGKNSATDNDVGWLTSAAISITGNAANVTGTVTVEHGGTGATTAAGARTNLGLGSIATHAEGDYVLKTGDTMSGQLKTSFQSSVAIGSYGTNQTTIGGLAEEIRFSSGAMGSINVTTAYTSTAGGSIGTGWYNYIYSPHRTGGLNGNASGDNHQYGSLFLSGMTANLGVWYVRITSGAIAESRRVWIAGNAVTSAVWNDYAEYRHSICHEPGYCVQELGDDSLTKTQKRLDHFAGVTSDTWGFAQGKTDVAKTPIAVAGRVLVYTFQDRNNYKPGDCVCAAPNGTVDIMTRDEIIQYPDRIVGTVSCVPTYDIWGGGELADRPPIKVNGRIWIKVR